MPVGEGGEAAGVEGENLDYEVGGLTPAGKDRWGVLD